MKSLARSQAARRRAAAAAAIAGVGAGILGTQSAEAGIVTINLASAGSPGVNISGPNAGLPTGSPGNYTFSKTVSNFPLSGGGTLALRNYFGSNGSTGLSPSAGLTIAVDGGDASPHNFAGGASIGSTFGGTWSSLASQTYFYAYNSAKSPNFGADSYLGFKTSQGNYGWLKATWNRDSYDFQLYSGAYESVVGVSINAGQTSSAPVPEIDPSGLASAMSLVMGSAAMLEQRRRKRAAVAAESAAVTA
jgi:hypothetical protein